MCSEYIDVGPKQKYRVKRHFIHRQGDSGSALLCVHDGRLAIVGIISYGVGCGVSGMPGVYTSVTHYVDFIQEVVKT